MDISGLTRFSGGYVYTRTAKSETGKAANFDEGCEKASAEKAGADAGTEKTEGCAPAKDPHMIKFRLKYSPSFIALCDGYCIAEFGFDDGTPWDPSEMTDDEWRLLQLDTGGLPVVLIPPNIAKRMNSGDGKYADHIFSEIDRYMESQGGDLKDAKLPLDEFGNIMGMDSKDNLYVKMPENDDTEKGFWEARAERQDEYIKYCQQKAMEHRIAVSKEFAALRKDGEGLSTEELLSGAAASEGTGGAAGISLEL